MGSYQTFLFAYRKFHSCETSLLRHTEDWRRSRDKKELVGIVSLDLSKAFDTIPHALLLAKLVAALVRCSRTISLEDCRRLKSEM